MKEAVLGSGELFCDLLSELEAEEGQLLGKESWQDIWVEVWESPRFRWMHFGGSGVQSVMSLENPTIPIIPNHVFMLVALLLMD